MTVHSSISLELEEPISIYSQEELSHLDVEKIPKHIAIIMDGNRRWAKQKDLPLNMGHWEGAEVLIDVVRAAAELGCQTLTVYSFSTENWERPAEEIDALMNVFELYLIRKRDMMVREGIRLDAIGDLSRLPDRVKVAFEETKMATKDGNRINLILAINYGARDEIRRAVVKILQENEKKKIEIEQVSEEFISQNLDTQGARDPDLLIRTSGELRLSNFLLWQISYTELFYTDVLWPDFSAQNLYEAVMSFQQRNRRRGGDERFK